ncbi:hypothetical protein [Tenacibaculum sp. M341]|uniref:hypothetical protein n=1 Tax=Tenacibaculum sp. M341 TaxID=2530339 RepID=UPI0010473BEB|nr:hypothetical protein [Tenacibaculum sp. M341]TCI93574.1 hypothetical protein EYW44_03965 [Tenacibaculum sp. M341]
MKNIVISLFFLFNFVFAFSQTKEDYKKALDLITKGFNEKNASLIHQKFTPDLKKELQENTFKKTIDSLHTDKGAMSTYELIMEEEKEKNYLVEFENGSMLILIHLSPTGEISMLKIKDY